jgi:hypothetical protein
VSALFREARSAPRLLRPTLLKLRLSAKPSPFAKHREMFRTFVTKVAVWHKALTRSRPKQILKLQ